MSPVHGFDLAQQCGELLARAARQPHGLDHLVGQDERPADGGDLVVVTEQPRVGGLAYLLGLVWREHVAIELAEALCEGAIGAGADRHE